MLAYKREYIKWLGYDETDFIPSELSGAKAQDIHHIVCRGMGGTKRKEEFYNLMALTRDEHEQYGDRKQYIDDLREAHYAYIRKRMAVVPHLKRRVEEDAKAGRTEALKIMNEDLTMKEFDEIEDCKHNIGR